MAKLHVKGPEQHPLYAALTYAQPGITDNDLLNYFKPAPIGPSGSLPDLPKPNIAGLSITRDEFGVPHIEAKKRTDAIN